MAALRFAPCVLNFCETTLSTPFLSARVASRVSILCFCQSERLPQLATSKNSVTRVLTLLTFCPPGPLLRETLKTSSSSDIDISVVISIIVSVSKLPGCVGVVANTTASKNIALSRTQQSVEIRIGSGSAGRFRRGGGCRLCHTFSWRAVRFRSRRPSRYIFRCRC